MIYFNDNKKLNLSELNRICEQINKTTNPDFVGADAHVLLAEDEIVDESK